MFRNAPTVILQKTVLVPGFCGHRSVEQVYCKPEYAQAAGERAVASCPVGTHLTWRIEEVSPEDGAEVARAGFPGLVDEVEAYLVEGIELLRRLSAAEAAIEVDMNAFNARADAQSWSEALRPEFDEIDGRRELVRKLIRDIQVNGQGRRDI